MIRVNQLHIKNIGPFKNETFDFSVEKGNPDVHILTGPNGTGKTTILHAIASEFDYFENNHKEHLSNLFYKRFHLFDEDKNEMAKSYCHSIIENKDSGKVVEKVVAYGCKYCGNIHQAYEKTITNSNKITKRSNGYDSKPQSADIQKYKNSIVAKDLSNKKQKFSVFGYSGYRFINSANVKIDQDVKFNPLHLALEFVKKNDENTNISNWIISRYSKAAIEETHGNKKQAEKYREGLNCLMESISELTDNVFQFQIKTNPWKVILVQFGNEIEFDVLPDGLRSLLSWLGDILMRLDEIPWENEDIPINHQNIILMLDEIEVHLHPKWQYQILPLIMKLFPNSQIFLSTHSPFILNSIDRAKIYVLRPDEEKTSIDRIQLSETGDSYSYIYETILQTKNRFGYSTIKNLERFNEIDSEMVLKDFKNEDEFVSLIQELKKDGEEITSIIASKLIRLKDVIGKDYLNGKD